MTGRRTLLIVASALCAALGTTLVWLYAQSATRPELDPSYVAVLAAAGDAGAGTSGAELQTRAIDVRADQAAGLVRTPAEIAGKVLVTRVVTGQPLTLGMFGMKPVADVAAANVAVSVTVTDARRVPALLQAGQDVAVYVVPADRCPDLVLEKARVARVGAAAPAGTPGQPGPQLAPQIVTFDVGPNDALALLALKTGDDVALALLGESAKPVEPPCAR
jgi:hypothetical protein